MAEFEMQKSHVVELQTLEFDKTGSKSKRMIDDDNVGSLTAEDRRAFIEQLIKNVEEDNRRLLEKIRERIERVGVKLPTVEVKYHNLSVHARCRVVHGKPLPTLWNTIIATLKGVLSFIGLKQREVNKSILKDVSGIIKPSRLTLLLGPPGCGKTTFLLALAGKLNQDLKMTGEVAYNGWRLEEFIPEKTSAYISQYDHHIPELTVRETLDFSARCQGVGSMADILNAVRSREEQEGISPDPEIDAYMKAIASKDSQVNLQTDYIMKILGLDICSEMIIGDSMRRGISGGQKKRLTTGEMMVGPTRALFMDEISTGLDSTTTFQIISCIHNLVHIAEVTAVVSLLQPAPETFNLFDDVIMMAEGKIIYHGPCHLVLDFFEYCGFRCPGRKGIADFLQEVISEKDQVQYWYQEDIPYSYVTADQFSKMFKECHIGKQLAEEISKPNKKSKSNSTALSFTKYSQGHWELFKVCMAREYVLMKRDSFVYVFKAAQLVIVALITTSVYMGAHLSVDLVHASYYVGSLNHTIIRIVSNAIAELTLSIPRLQIFYKQRDCCFYPAWAYTIPASILKIPFSLLESFIWTILTYYPIGYSPEAERFFRQLLLIFLLHQASTSFFRFIASVSPTPITSLFRGNLVLMTFFLLSGFILPRTSSPSWLHWGFWFSPISYAEIGISINEFHAPRWQKLTSENITIGQEVLRSHGLNFGDELYWLSIVILFGFVLLFNICLTMVLTYTKNSGSLQIISQGKGEQISKQPKILPITSLSETAPKALAGGMVLPFEPLTITFQDLQYFIDMPQRKLQLLHNVTGAFRPGVLTALMGLSGAGKTTLMDVLCGRKTNGTITGEIRICGYPKVQETFARVSGYCEQTDTHSPQLTVEESLVYSAWLRLPPEIDPETKFEFVEDVLQVIELDGIKDAIVGVAGMSGLSTEQRKRLTIAVELVANPSIIFMDEPTSGLEARAAAIVIRAVKNIVVTGRTVVCTIHQPSIDIFESFDEVLLIKRGGHLIYSGPLGKNSDKLIEYFESISGIPKIKENYNPATWALEVTSTTVEQKLGIDFADVYAESSLCWRNIKLVKQLSEPTKGSKELQFLTRYPQNGWTQFKACLWKQHISYWRSPTYNLLRIMFTTIVSILFGALYWQHGKQINNEQDILNIVGSLFLMIMFLGIMNCTTIIPIIARERIVFCREKFAGMYSSIAFSLSQVAIEVPYIFVQSLICSMITYPSVGYYFSTYKVLWYSYTTFCTMLSFNYLGMVAVSLSPSDAVAVILASASYTLLVLFSGFFIPKPKIPALWGWFYKICPTSWSLSAYLTSQYGAIRKEISVLGKPSTIDAFLNDYYGFHEDQLAVAAFVLLSFPVVFAALFVLFIGNLNFQRR